MHLEKEVKILDIEDVTKIQETLETLGATFLGRKDQSLYTYDLMAVYHRFLEVRALLQIDNQLIYSTNLRKLKLLMEEAKLLVAENVRKTICEKYGIGDLDDVENMTKDQIYNFIHDGLLEAELNKHMINSNKWIRLRKSGDKVELTVKHIQNEAIGALFFQKVQENEIVTSSFEETNSLLEALGFVRRNYQEKIRYSYLYKGAKVEIDIWPIIKPYIEIECDDVELIQSIIRDLGLTDHRMVSCNTADIYKMIGIDIKTLDELKFS